MEWRRIELKTERREKVDKSLAVFAEPATGHLDTDFSRFPCA